MGQILKDQKEFNKKISYEDISTDLENSSDMVYYLDIEPENNDNVIPDLISSIKDILELDDLSENEYKLGLALSDIFENYESIFPATDNNKFNKNFILLSFRKSSKVKVLFSNELKKSSSTHNPLI